MISIKLSLLLIICVLLLKKMSLHIYKLTKTDPNTQIRLVQYIAIDLE